MYNPFTTKVIKDGIRWLAFKTFTIKKLQKEINIELVSRLNYELINSSVNFVIVGFAKAGLPLFGRTVASYLILYEWGFKKKDALNRLKKSCERVKSLARMVGFDIDESTKHDLNTFDLISMFLTKLDDFPRLDLNPSQSGQIKIGKTLTGEEVSLALEDFFKHFAVLGETGSGKSTFVSKIVKNWSELDQHYLIFDWHGEYMKLLNDNSALLVTPEQDFGFDIFEYPTTADPFEHIDLLMEVFSESFDLSVSQQYVLRIALKKAYTEKGHGMSNHTKPVTVDDVIKAINEIRTYSGWEQESKLAVLRRVSKIADTGLKNLLNASQKVGFDNLTKENIIIDLGKLSDDYAKIFVIEAIVRILYNYRLARKITEPHLLVIEEARNVVPFRRQEEPPRMMERLVEELRKFNESVMVVNQLPSTISQELLSAVGNIAVFRLKADIEQDILVKRCGFEKEILKTLSNLSIGQAIFRGHNGLCKIIEYR
ncbi:hypothetical protein B9Q02_01130 [Candidatus Marsarchaeota G1 archaeon BE_D]|jgi:DNA helicase HerA-like ATPase|uniref:Helicase HerA central domain-containing protein n=1 Tax=Candidatus Marsarchaeota G1 archaeon BE_D TaxID=1978156 RepID=A0A2R6AKA5_9ARCH|nr:MAG: hypothetical protein B9Q02_01130 [Candidatus Marsarchaeota G1 archaeon BE_D]